MDEMFKVIHIPSGKEMASNVKLAQNFYDRLLGLMFIKQIAGYDGLLLKPCNSIHTFFMRFAIDVLFLDSSDKVVKVFRNLKPWRLTRMYFTANKVLEMEAGSIEENVQQGDQLEFICIN